MPALQQQAARTAKTLRVSSARVAGVMWQARMHDKLIRLNITILLSLFLFVIPPVALFNCTGGWGDAGAISGSNCIITYQPFIELGGFVMGLIYISSFMLYIPIIIYIAVSVFIIKVISGSTTETSNHLQKSRHGKCPVCVNYKNLSYQPDFKECCNDCT